MDTIEAEPLTLIVPLGHAERETDLMAALECVIEHWHWTIHTENEAAQPEIARAVRWLAEKYGQPEPPQ